MKSVLAFIAAAAAVKVTIDPPYDGSEDAWFDIPKFTDSTKDPHDVYGHEFQRRGNQDWLDKHVVWKAGNDEHANVLAGPNPEENREAIADS